MAKKAAKTVKKSAKKSAKKPATLNEQWDKVIMREAMKVVKAEENLESAVIEAGTKRQYIASEVRRFKKLAVKKRVQQLQDILDGKIK